MKQPVFLSKWVTSCLHHSQIVGWKPRGATLLGFDVDKGCEGETERPKTMPTNVEISGTFLRVMKCQALLERENDPSGTKTMKKESFDVAIWISNVEC